MRMKSLGNDKADNSSFRHHRGREMGHCVSSEFYQPQPFFFTRECASVPLVGHYRGCSAFYIGNGPSLVSGRYDLSLLKKPGVITYGINNGPRTIRPNLWSCVDDPKRFIKSIWLDPTIMKIVPHAHAEKPIFDNEKWLDNVEIPHPITNKPMKVLVGDCPNVIYFHRNEKFVAERWLWEDKINWGNHGDFGGGRSVMLATLRIMFLLGFRNVYLLGADFDMSAEKTYHFDEQREKGAVNGNLSSYKKMMEEYFPALKKEFDAADFKVYNCTEGSALKVFPFVKYEDAIASTIKNLGDTKNERTWGMYTKPEDRSKFKDQPKEKDKKNLIAINNRPSEPIVSQIEKMDKIQNVNFFVEKEEIQDFMDEGNEFDAEPILNPEPIHKPEPEPNNINMKTLPIYGKNTSGIKLS